MEMDQMYGSQLLRHLTNGLAFVVPTNKFVTISTLQLHAAYRFGHPSRHCPPLMREYTTITLL